MSPRYDNVTALRQHHRVTTTSPRYDNVTALRQHHRVTTTSPRYDNATALRQRHRVTTTPPRYDNTTTLRQHHRVTTTPPRYDNTTAPRSPRRRGCERRRWGRGATAAQGWTGAAGARRGQPRARRTGGRRVARRRFSSLIPRVFSPTDGFCRLLSLTCARACVLFRSNLFCRRSFRLLRHSSVPSSRLSSAPARASGARRSRAA